MLYVVLLQEDEDVDERSIRKVLNEAHSWYSHPSGWNIICTNESASEWTNKFYPLVKNGGHVIILPIDLRSERQGWMAMKFWKWCNAHQACFGGPTPKA